MKPPPLLLLPILTVVLAAASAAGGTSELAWTAHGWDGWFRAGQRAPVIALVRHAGGPRRLALELRDAAGRLRVVQRFEVGGQTARRIEFVLPAPDRAERWTLRLVSGASLLASRSLDWRPIPHGWRLALTLGEPPPTLLPHLRALELVHQQPDPEKLPRRFSGWESVDLCLLRRTPDLAPELTRALQRHLIGGGWTVALLGDRPALPLGALLEGHVVRREPASTAPLFRWLGRRPPHGDETVETVQGAPPPDTLLAGSAVLPLVGLHRRGEGGVLAVHFRPSVLRGLDGEAGRELWRRLIERAGPPADQTGRQGVMWTAFERRIEQENQRRGPLVAPVAFALLYLLGLGPLVWWGGRRGGPAGRLLGLAAGVVLFAGLALALRGRLPRVGPALVTLGVRDVGAGWALERRLIALHHAAGRGRLSFVHDPSSDRVDALRFDLIGLVQAGEHELRADGRLLERDGPLAPARLALLRPESSPTGWRAEWRADGRLALEHPYARLRDPLLVIRGAIYRLPDAVRGRHLLQAVRLASAPTAQNGLQAALLREALSPGRLAPGEGLLIARLDAPPDSLRFPGLVIQRRRTELILRGRVREARR